MEKDLMTTRQLQELLQIDRTTVYRMLSDGRIPGFKVGGQWRFSRRAIEEWLEEQENTDAGLSQGPEASVTDAANLLQMGWVQPIQDIFAIASGVGVIITRLDGRPMTQISNSCRFCNTILSRRAGMEACVDSWHVLASQKGRRPIFQACHAGLMYARGLVEVKSEPVATVFVGQLSALDVGNGGQNGREDLRKKVPELAYKYGLDENELLDSVDTVYCLDGDKQARMVDLLQMVSDTLAEMGRERALLLGKLRRIAEITSS